MNTQLVTLAECEAIEKTMLVNNESPAVYIRNETIRRLIATVRAYQASADRVGELLAEMRENRVGGPSPCSADEMRG